MNETGRIEAMTEEQCSLCEDYALEYSDLAEIVGDFTKMVNLTRIQEVVFYAIVKKERKLGALKERLEAQGMNEDAAFNFAMENGLL